MVEARNPGSRIRSEHPGRNASWDLSRTTAQTLFVPTPVVMSVRPRCQQFGWKLTALMNLEDLVSD